MAATNINRVILTGNLTRDPELRSTPSGTSVCSLRLAVNSRRKDSERRVDRQAQLLRHHGLGRAGRELRQLPQQGPPGRDRRPARVARVGGQGRLRQAPERRGDRRLRPVPRLARRRRRRERRTASPRHPTSPPTPPISRARASAAAATTTSPSRNAPRTPAGARRRPAAAGAVATMPWFGSPGRPPGDFYVRTAHTWQGPETQHHSDAAGARPTGCDRANTRGSTSRRSTTRTSTCCAGSSPTRARPAPAGSPGSRASTRSQLAVAVKRAREIALLPYVGRALMAAGDPAPRTSTDLGAARRRRRGLARLPPQLPGAEEAGAAGDRRRARAGAAAPRGGRARRARGGRPGRTRPPPCSRRRC